MDRKINRYQKLEKVFEYWQMDRKYDLFIDIYILLCLAIYFFQFTYLYFYFNAYFTQNQSKIDDRQNLHVFNHNTSNLRAVMSQSNASNYLYKYLYQPKLNFWCVMQ